MCSITSKPIGRFITVYAKHGYMSIWPPCWLKYHFLYCCNGTSVTNWTNPKKKSSKFTSWGPKSKVNQRNSKNYWKLSSESRSERKVSPSRAYSWWPTLQSKKKWPKNFRRRMRMLKHSTNLSSPNIRILHSILMITRTAIVIPNLMRFVKKLWVLALRAKSRQN